MKLFRTNDLRLFVQLNTNRTQVIAILVAIQDADSELRIVALPHIVYEEHSLLTVHQMKGFNFFDDGSA